MRTFHPQYRKLPLRLAVLAIAALAGCGGGGGGSSEPITPTLAPLAVTNRDAAAHATAAAAYAFGFAASTGLVDVTAGQGMQARARAFAVDRARTQAAIVLPTIACPYGGTYRAEVDDANNNYMVDIGETMKMHFDQCLFAPGEVVNGAVDATLNDMTATDSDMTMSFRGLQTQSADLRHDLTMQGDVSVRLNLNGALQTATLAARGPVTLTVRTHTDYEDTVTLQDGWRQAAVYDMSSGITSTTFDGYLQSTAVGGTVRSATTAALMQRDSAEQPHAGAVRVSGQGSSLTLTVAQAGPLKLELDDNADGRVEHSTEPTWDWLY
jgi:hypothetical protein